MKIKMLVPACGPIGIFEYAKEYEVSKEIGEMFHQAGSCEILDADPAEETAPPAEDEAPEGESEVSPEGETADADPAEETAVRKPGKSRK